MTRLLFAALIALVPMTAHAFDRVIDQSAFLTLLSGKSLTNRLYGLTIQVAPSGRIAGDALGRNITGDWRWDNGFFCREMAWGNDPIPYNCQLVEAQGNQIRFTSDQGTGDTASFKLR